MLDANLIAFYNKNIVKKNAYFSVTQRYPQILHKSILLKKVNLFI